MDKTYLAQFAIVALAHLLAVMSPGPDFAVVTRNSLTATRRSGVYTSLGLAFGVLVHVAYCLIGIGYVISKSILLFAVVKYLGAAYLMYIGWQALRSKLSGTELDVPTAFFVLGDMAAFRMGFLTNVLNPKATLFFLGLFTQVVVPGTPVSVQALYGLEMFAATFLWFSLVALMFSNPAVKARFKRIAHRIDRICGVVLMALGIKVALSR